MFWKFASLRKENQTSSEETLIVAQLLHHVQTKETNYKNLFSQLERVLEKHELSLSYMVTVLTITWSFVQVFSKHLSPVLVV
jgi:hypothetical protein